MRLTAVFLLVSLMLCCCTATGSQTCPTLTNILFKFFTAKPDDYAQLIAPYAPTTVMKAAAAELKRCGDELPPLYRKAKKSVLINIINECEGISTVETVP